MSFSFNAETLAKVLGVSVSSCYELMHEKDFPVIRIGSRMAVPKDKLQLWIDAKTIKNEIESVERKVSLIIYKIAVEQAISNNILACYNGASDETVRELREMCSRDVAEIMAS